MEDREVTGLRSILWVLSIVLGMFLVVEGGVFLILWLARHTLVPLVLLPALVLAAGLFRLGRLHALERRARRSSTG